MSSAPDGREREAVTQCCRGVPSVLRSVGGLRSAALLAAVVAISVTSLRAQDPRALELPAPDTTTLYEITLRDGTAINGYIVTRDHRLIVRTLGGVELTLRPEDVMSVQRARGIIVGDALWPVDPSDTRLFLGPTARVLGPGRGYFGVYELFFVSGAVGIGDIAMLSGGLSLFPGIDFGEQVFYLTPKVRIINADYVQAAVSLFWMRPLTDEGSVGMVFGGLTAGSEMAAFSGGIGFPFASESGFADQQLVMLGGELRVTRRLKFISENWLVPGEDDAIVSGGFRIIFESATIEAALATTTSGEAVLPIVNFSLSW